MYGQRYTGYCDCCRPDGFYRLNSASVRNYWGTTPQLQSSANVRTRSPKDGYAVPGAKGVVRDVLRKNPVLLVAFSYCPACEELAAKLDEQRIPHRKFEVDRLPNKPEIMDEFEKFSGIRTAPQMYVKGRFIGDGSTTRRLIASGEFHRIIGRKNETNILNAPELVHSVLQRHPVLMMSFTYCPCCKNLAKALDAARIRYYKFDVDALPNRSEIIREFERLSGINTAPQMFVAGAFVGDGSSTEELISTGQLQRMIRSRVGR